MDDTVWPMEDTAGGTAWPMDDTAGSLPSMILPPRLPATLIISGPANRVKGYGMSFIYGNLL
jgi:hypothetical protein